MCDSWDRTACTGTNQSSQRKNRQIPGCIDTGQHNNQTAKSLVKKFPLRIGPWIKDRILLIDLGFYKHLLFAKIKDNGGYFVSRLKGNADPLIVGVNNTCRGNSIDVKGKYISEILPKFKRQVLDVEVEVTFKRPNYNGKNKTRMDAEQFRLVAVFNEDEEKYHVYLTNITKDVLEAEDVAKLYGARWGIEMVQSQMPLLDTKWRQKYLFFHESHPPELFLIPVH